MGIPDPIIGRKLGDYTILELLGKGGMARVYKGYDEALDRHAAVKVITSDFVATADEVEYKERFQREARAIARLRHPNIVGIYQFNDLDGLYYMAMVFLDGEDLRTYLKGFAEKGQKMPHSEILRMAHEVASALDYAHSQGVIHRDIKPSNIMMTSSGATLTDFGLALSTMEGTAGDTFGSAHYIAPEQAISSARAVPQSDLYSLGVVLYEAFTGKVPFDDPSVMSVALKHLNEPPPRPTESIRNFPVELEDVLMRVLSKDPTERYVSGAELVQALQQALPYEGDTAEMFGQQSPPTSSTSYPSLDIGVAASRPSMTSPKKAAGLGGVPAQNAEVLIKQAEEKSGDRAEKRRLPIVWIVAVFVLLLIGGGAFLAFSGSDDGDSSTDNLQIQAETDETLLVTAQTATAESAITAGVETSTAQAIAQEPSTTNTPTATETTEEVTATASPTAEEVETETMVPTDDEPTQTATSVSTSTPEPTFTSTATSEPTLTPTATDEPTATQTASATSTAVNTNTPAPTATTTQENSIPVIIVEDPDLGLRYENTFLILENISGATLNLSGLRFEGDTSGQFNASEWGSGLQIVNASLSRFRAGGCIQLSTQQTSFEPMDCRWYNVWIPRTTERYHFFTGDNELFSVFNNGILIGRCSVEAGNCEVSLDALDLDDPTTTSTEPDPTEVAQEPSETPTDTPTPTVEAPATVTLLPVTDDLEPDIELRYTDARFLLENVSGRTQDISGLRFEHENGRRFRAIDWNPTLRQVGASTTDYRTSGCVQIVTVVSAALNRPCLRYNVWIQRDSLSTSYFWGGNENTTFTVYLDETAIARCDVSTGSTETTCAFSLSGSVSVAPTNSSMRPTATATLIDDDPDAPTQATENEETTSNDETTDNILLRYDGQSILLENIGTSAIDIGTLTFIGNENGQFSSSSWENRLEDLDASLSGLEVGGCVQLVIDTSAVAEDACDAYNAWIRRGSSSSHFWLNSNGNTSFTITQGNDVMTECVIAPDDEETTCQFFLPSADD